MKKIYILLALYCILSIIVYRILPLFIKESISLLNLILQYYAFIVVTVSIFLFLKTPDRPKLKRNILVLCGLSIVYILVQLNFESISTIFEHIIMYWIFGLSIYVFFVSSINNKLRTNSEDS